MDRGVVEVLMLAFDAEKHEYRWSGQPVPHVTGILAPLIDFSMIDPVVLERARELGQRTHKLIELECKTAGGIDITKLDPFWQPYLTAFRAFVAETGFKLQHSERPVFHKVYGYAGTLDLEGELFSDDAIIDVKKSFAGGAVIGLQVAAYREARNAERPGEGVRRKIKRCFALRLKPGSTPAYQLREFTDEADFGVFLGLLKVQRWKERYDRE